MTDLLEAAKAVHPENADTALSVLQHLASAAACVLCIEVTEGRITGISGNVEASAGIVSPILRDALGLAIASEMSDE